MERIKKIVYVGRSGQFTIPKSIRDMGYSGGLFVEATREAMIIKRVEP